MKQVKIGGGQRLSTHRQLLAIRYPHEKNKTLPPNAID